MSVRKSDSATPSNPSPQHTFGGRSFDRFVFDFDPGEEELGAAAAEATPPPERPEWLPSNFNDPADLAKSYQSAQAELTRAKQEAAAERAAREALEAQQYEAQQSQVQSQQQNELVSRYEQAVESGDYTTQLAIQAHIAQQAALQAAQANQSQQPVLPQEFVADYADKTVAGKFGDWDSYKTRAVSWLSENPYLITDEVRSNPNLLAQRLEVAYKAVKADDLIAGNIPVQADLSSAKEQAQTMSGAGVRQPSQSDTEAWAKAIAEANKNLGGFSTF